VAAVFVHEFEVGPAAVDENGHVNNVEYVRWMQEAAVLHADDAGCTAATKTAGATWVVRSHQIEYRRPAFGGDRVQVLTWVADFRRAFSLRKYKFVRPADNTVLAEGQTDWVFVDTQTGRPQTVPVHIQALFELLPEGPQPIKAVKLPPSSPGSAPK
jgi:acyl-CoA thioester hydrolase